MQNYWRSYGFTQDPFNPEKTLLFTPKSWEDYLDLLPQFSRFCNTLLIIIGSDKVGKTTLLKLFLKQESQQKNTILLAAKDCQNVGYLLKLLAERFFVPYNSNSDLPVSDQLEEQLNYLKLHKENRLLIIDDAENLPLDMRQACLQIIQQQNTLETCLPVILVGNPILREQFNALLTSKTANECLHIIELAALTLVETHDYLYSTCESVSGRQFVFPFSDVEVEMIYQHSHGMIGHINAQAREILRSKSKPTFDWDWRQLLHGKLAWWLAIMVIIIAVLFIFRSINYGSIDHRSIDQYEPIIKVTKPLPPRTLESPEITNNKNRGNSDYQTGNMIVKSSNSPASASTLSQETAKPTVMASTVANVTLPIVTAPTSLPAAPPAPSLTATDAPAEMVAEAPHVKPVKHEPVKSILFKAEPVTSALIKSEPMKSEPIKSKIKIKVKAEPKKTTEQRYFNSVMTKKMALQKKQILLINPRFFTLQLLSSSNLHTIAKFVADNQLQATVKVIPIKHADQDWYIVIYGAFQNSAEAKQGITELNPSLKKLKPWVRSYQSVHHVMKV